MVTIKHREFANVVKTTAKMVLPLTSKKEKLQLKIVELAKEIEAINADIDTYQDRVKSLSGGLTTEQLVVRKKDAEGKYTSLFEANPEYVYFDDDKRVYVVRGTEDADPMSPEENEAANEAAAQMYEGVEAPTNDDMFNA